MYNQNIADYILYSLASERADGNMGVNSSLISDVVEGWNRQIYVVPNKGVKSYMRNNHQYPLM